MPFLPECDSRRSDSRLRTGNVKVLGIIEVGVVLATSCQSNTLDSGGGQADKQVVVQEFGPAEVLSNMPMNSDSRCTGICLTAEAILDGELLSGGHDEPQEVGTENLRRDWNFAASPLPKRMYLWMARRCR